MSKKVMLVAGEASGDAHGAEVVRALKQHQHVECIGIGGNKMKEAGCSLLFDYKSIAVMGLFEVIKHFPAIRQAWKIAVAALAREKPDCLILIDYPGFNLRLAAEAKRLGIKVVYYVSPQIWAWKKKRIHKIKAHVDHMAVILPFEAEIYEKAGVPVTFVGSPLLEQVQPMSQKEARALLNLSEQIKLIGLLPGSRHSEVSRLLPELIDVAESLKVQYPHIQFILPLADTIKESEIWPYLDDTKVPILLVKRNSHAVMSACDVLVGSSGTATLEAAILGVPMVVIYKMHALTFEIAKWLVKIKYISLPNLLGGKLIYPEFIQKAASSVNIVQAIQIILDAKEEQTRIKKELEALRALLGSKGAGKRVADLALALC